MNNLTHVSVFIFKMNSTYGTNLKYCNIYIEIQQMEMNTLELQPLTFYQLHLVVEWIGEM